MKLNDLIERLTSWKTTAMGIAMAVITILVGFGIVGKENVEGAEQVVAEFWDGVVLALVGIAGMINIFSKDEKPS